MARTSADSTRTTILTAISARRSFGATWWYTSCHHSNLHVLNLNRQNPSYADGIDWSQFYEVTGRNHYSYTEVQMKIRKVGFSPGALLLPDPIAEKSDTAGVSEL
ncbi:hypothetical protein HPB47_022042 [Ixodes persulcatus]|uniref:Uncharacterized protein n=1 Tax=Ixodes persulcatus TaxID=34615 RepID=A0AC60QAU8_IXOPE|nr:hypothetical protein HPB47_022042 [Ixodes persulcatus]